MDPLKVVTDFFSTGWPDDHRRRLKEWRYYVLNDEYYKGRNGPGHVLFIYEQTVQLIEALYLLLFRNIDRWPRLDDVSDEQIEQEKIDWVYFPKDLSAKELANPYKAVKRCFKKISPQDYRDYLYEWLYSALYETAVENSMSAGEIIDVYDNVRKLYSAAWLIHQRETAEAITHRSWGTGKVDTQLTEAIDITPLAPLKDINPQLSDAEKLILEEIKAHIADRIPSVRMIYLMGTHHCPFTYYLLILVDDKEKITEHEIANKIEDNCRHLASVFAIVHKFAGAEEGLATDRRFWHHMLYRSIRIYNTSAVELPEARAISDIVWLERAQHDWNRCGVQGKEFMKGAVRYMDDGNFTLGLFSLHQAAESSLMAVNKAVLGYCLSAHNLSRNIRMTLLFTEDIKAVLALDTPEGVQLFNLLQAAYTETRYKSEFKPDEDLVRLAKEKIELLLRKIEQVYQQFINNKTSI